jgi:hypothetical protein
LVMTCVAGPRFSRAASRPSQQVGGDQEEGVVAGQGGVVVVQLLQSLGSLFGRAERQLAPRSSGVGRCLLASGVQDAGNARDTGVDGEPGAARLQIAPADQRRSRPVPGWRLPRAARELIAEAEQQQWHPSLGEETDDDGAHTATLTRTHEVALDPQPGNANVAYRSR